MAEVAIETARIVDRDQLVTLLREQGVEAHVLDDGLEIPCDDDTSRLCDELVARLESWIGELGVPLVPERGDGRVFLRPPAG